MKKKINQLKKKNMNDNAYDRFLLSREIIRRYTFGDYTLKNVRNDLVKAGFYYKGFEQRVACFSCNFEFDVKKAGDPVDFVKYHQKNSPKCVFVKTLQLGGNASKKKFLCFESLYYEKARLETFIDWPIPWIYPEELAAAGFYYLRTRDHCACVYCFGIIGDWEEEDTPLTEHKRHFPHCPFLKGMAVGNIPMEICHILDKLPLDGEECPIIPPARSKTNLSQSENTTGLRSHYGPMKNDYITLESRYKSFGRWPERVVQQPRDMATAGFYYYGVGDHVRCFHCGNGLRNWETDDDPWEEHARWYPDCVFVYLSKGQKFIDDILRVKPPKAKPSSGRFNTISENDLNRLLDSDIAVGVKSMGFSCDKIREALGQRLAQTGMLFSNGVEWIEAILKSAHLTQEIANSEDVTPTSRYVTSDESNKYSVSPLQCIAKITKSTSDDKENVTMTESLKKKQEDSKETSCKVCMDAQAEIVLLPCTHMVACSNCTSVLTLCPICRNDIKYTIKPIMS